MNLSALFLETLNFGTEAQNKNGSTVAKNADQAFDNVFAAATERQQSYKRTGNSTLNQQENTKKHDDRKTKSVQKKYDNKNTTDRSVNKFKDKSGGRTELNTQDTDEITSVKETGGQAQDKEKPLIKEIAKSLGVDEEEVESLLQQMGISAEELLDTDNLTAFMQLLSDVENPIDLLAFEGVKEAMASVREIISDFEAAVVTKPESEQALERVTGNIIKEDFEDALDETFNNTYAKEAVKEDIAKSPLTSTSKDQLTEESTVTLKTEKITENVSKSEIYEDTDAGDDYAASADVKNEAETDGGGSYQFQNQQQSQNVPDTDAAQDGNTANIIDGTVKAFTEALAKTQTERSAANNPSRIIEQMIQKLKMNLTDNVTEIKITLKPDFLGDVTLKVASENGVVSAMFIAENQKIKETIEANFNQLKDTLIELGIEVSELSVSVGQEDNYPNSQFTQNQEKSQKRIQDIIDGINETDDNQNYVQEDEVLETNINYRA